MARVVEKGPTTAHGTVPVPVTDYSDPGGKKPVEDMVNRPNHYAPNEGE